VASNIVPENSPLLRWGGKLVKSFTPSPEQGAATSTYLALSPEVCGISGKYFDENQNMIEPSPRTWNRRAQDCLWQKSLQLVGCEASNR
jgi:retinol dehydrogenase-12